MTSTTITSSSGQYIFAASDVTLTNASTISGTVGVSSTFSNDTLINLGSGLIQGTSGNGVALYKGGVVTNTGGLIEGSNGVGVAAAAGLVTNSGTIIGTNRQGVGLGDGGSIDNSGLISGVAGVYVGAAAGTVTNTNTILGASSYGVLLHNGGIVTNTAGLIQGSKGVTITGTIGVTGTINNAGTIIGTSSYGAALGEGGNVGNSGLIEGGVDIAFGSGTLTNTVANSGTILGAFNGVYIARGGVVSNSAGLIQGFDGAIIVGGLAIISNAATITGVSRNGVAIYDGGTIDNSGLIQGFTNGAYISFGAATLENSGTISGGTSSVKFRAGFNDRLIVDPGAVFAGAVDGGNTFGATATTTLALASGASEGTLTSLGSQFTDFAQITVDTGAYWSLKNQTIATSITLTNSGTIGSNVHLAAGASLTNAAYGVINAGTASYAIYDNAAAILNYGSIDGIANGAVYLANGGLLSNASGGVIVGYQLGADLAGPSADTVINAGSIIATTNFGVQVEAAYSQITNQSGGLIHGNSFGVIADGTVSVTNAGSVHGGYSGVLLRNGGLFVNQSGGTVTGSNNGVDWQYTAGTVVNAGSIGGGSLAVRFRAFDGNRLIVDPGAAFSGLVDGGNTIGSTAVSTLELASGSSVGTLTGLGASIVHFAEIDVDAGAFWRVNVAALGAGYGIDVAGTLVNQAGSVASVVTLEAGASFRNLFGATVSSGALTNTHQGVVYGSGAGVTIINNGTIADTGALGDGIALKHGGSIANGATATIVGHAVGAFVTAAAGIVTNSGTILGSINNGVALYDGGTITNLAGLIQGTNAVGIAGTSGFVSNAGTMIGTTRQGAGLGAGGSVYNSGLIEGVTGVYIGGGVGTLTNAGSISASSDAVFFQPGHADRLIVVPGAAFTGTVDGGNKLGATVASTMELASGASAGTLSSAGSQYIDFAQFALDAGASWALSSNSTIVAAQTIAFGGGGIYLHLNAPGAVAGHLTNFAVGDTIDLKGIDPASVGYSSGTLSFAGGAFELSLGGGGTLVTTASADGAALGVLCFCADTMILTPSGERRVQELAVGDLVTTANGAKRPIVWIGSGKVLATRGRRSAATPVIVRKDAIATDVPLRDLHVTKGHSLFIDDVLIPVEFLVNHRSIVWDDRAQEVELYHVELEDHDVLIADGAAAESYRDDGNRWLFFNTNAGWQGQPREPCAPILTGGPIVDTVWRRLLYRTEPRPSVPLTHDPDLHLIVDRVRVDPSSRRGDVITFRVPHRPTSVRIVSRAATPDTLGLARDPRELGVALRRIMIVHGRKLVLVEAEDARLTEGFHSYEPRDAIRWTNGDALLPPELFDGFDGRVQIELIVAHATQYTLACKAA
jgi:Hint domain